MNTRRLRLALLVISGWLFHPGAGAARAIPPKLVLVTNDDRGYVDLSCHGRPFVLTLHLDALHATGVRLTDFHVAPMCSPTRGQLLTGRNALRNGSCVIASSRRMARAGTYEFALRRRPEASGLSLRAAAPPRPPRDTATPDHAGFPAGVALPIASAQLRVGEQRETRTVTDSDRAAVFRLPLEAGRTKLEATFQDADGRHLCPAFFVAVQIVN